MTKIGAQQPYFLPDFRYFYKIYLSDYFLIADHLLFRKQSPIVRTRLNAQSADKYLTIPVQHQANPHPPLYRVQIQEDGKWRRKHLRTIQSLYGNTPYFEHYFPQLEMIYQMRTNRLTDFLIEIIHWQVKLLFPTRSITTASQQHIHSITDLHRWISRQHDPHLMVYPKEEEYYQIHFPEFPREKIKFTHPISFPDDYAPDLPLLFLLFTRGPEAIFYFRK